VLCAVNARAEMQESHKVIAKIVWFKHHCAYGKLHIWKGCNWLVLTISYSLYETFHYPFLVMPLIDR